jgi:CMP-N-acetylneuraminic acid synthetase
LKIKSKPLVEWTFDIFEKKNIRKLFVNVLASTDSAEIINISKKYKFLIPLIRPKSLSNKFTTSEAAALHAIEWYEKNFEKIDGIFLFQPTSPFRMDSKIILATKLFLKYNKQIVSICGKKSYKFDKNEINGSIYLSPVNILKKYKTFSKKGFVPIRMFSSLENIDIDTKYDLNRAIDILKNFKNKNKPQ